MFVAARTSFTHYADFVAVSQILTGRAVRSAMLGRDMK
jgi:hypothetical protein